MRTKYLLKTHSIDIIFVLLLLSVFSGGAISMAAIGSNLYKSTVHSMDQNAQNRTCAAYLTEKLNQNDHAGSIRCMDLSGVSALCISQEINGTEYTTYIYAYDGCIREITTNNNNSFSLDAGQYIMDADSLNITSVNSRLFSIEVSFPDKRSEDFYIATESIQ